MLIKPIALFNRLLCGIQFDIIVCHEGLPRSGKSYEALVNQIIPALLKGRCDHYQSSPPYPPRLCIRYLP